MSAKPRRPAARPATAAPIYQLKVALAGIEPPIWRRITVRGDLPLDRLHAVFQKAMGWQTSHLHEWLVGGRRYGEPVPDEPHYEVEDELQMTLREAAPIEGAGFKYVYDLGDGWIHDVLVEKINPPGPPSSDPGAWPASAPALPRTAAAGPATRTSCGRSAIRATPSTGTCRPGRAAASTPRPSTSPR
jgi:hypothetical protein